MSVVTQKYGSHKSSICFSPNVFLMRLLNARPEGKQVGKNSRQESLNLLLHTNIGRCQMYIALPVNMDVVGYVRSKTLSV